MENNFKNNNKANSVLLGIIGGIILIFIFYAVFYIDGNKNIDSGKIIDQNTNNQTINTVNANIGEIVSYNDWEINITNVNLSSSSYDNSKTITVRLNVKNLSNSTRQFLPSYYISKNDIIISLIYTINGKEYKYNYKNTTDSWAEEELYKSISPLNSREGVVKFRELPDEIFNKNGNLVIKITTNDLNSKNDIKWDITQIV